MRFTKFILLISLVVPVFLSASSYIKVTTTKSTKKLKMIKAKMKTMELRPGHKKTKTHYVIYSGPYENIQIANRDMKKISKYFPSAELINTNKNQSQDDKNKKIEQKNNFHVGISVGYSTAASTLSGDETKIETKPETAGLSYLVNGGYTFDNGIDWSLAYMLASTGDLSYTNIYTSLNYQFDNFDNFVPYVGLIVGYSSLTWDISPTTNPERPDSTSAMYGLQAGFSYPLSDSMFLTSSYLASMMDHKANILDDSDATVASIEHGLMHTVLFGVEFQF